MEIVSWNVNGIRACAKKGLIDWVRSSRKHHIVCFQETKANSDQVAEVLSPLKNYHHFSFSAQKPGYSGVALICKKSGEKPEIEYGIGIKKFDSEGRFLMAEFPDFFLINGYYPNGQRDHGRVDYKLDFSQAVAEKGLALRKKFKKEVILCGDFNTAHKEIDLKNPKSNANTTGFLPRERAWLDSLIAMGYTDCFRHHNGDIPDQYTWWTYRGNCRQRNIGWRIDYFFVTKGLVSHIKKSAHHPEVMGSDHCPLSLEI